MRGISTQVAKSQRGFAALTPAEFKPEWSDFAEALKQPKTRLGASEAQNADKLKKHMEMNAIEARKADLLLRENYSEYSNMSLEYNGKIYTWYMV